MATSLRTTDRWLESVCKHFSQATGWPLGFARRGSERADRFEASTFDGDSVWVGPVDNGAERIGFLFIDLPADRRVDRTFLGVCDLATLVAELVSGQCSALHRLETHSHQLATLVDVGMHVPKEEDASTALRKLLGAALKLTGFRSVGFFLLEPTTRELRLRVEDHLELRSIPQPVRHLDASPVDIQALTNERTFIRRDSHAGVAPWLPDDSLMAGCVRVPSNDGPMGTLWAFDRRGRNPSDREFHVLQSVAAQAAAALERVVLLKESQVQQRLMAELAIASENQQIEHEPLKDPRIDVAGYCRSRKELGGDLCEIVPLDEARTLVAVGDASGDSIPASLVMATVRGSLRTLVTGRHAISTPTDLLMSRINEALFATTPAHLFMSMIIGVIDSLEGTFTYTNAGHPTPLIVHGRDVIPTTSHGMLLGVTPDTHYERSMIALTPGDVIVLYSDGISEARDRSKKMFRSDGILDAVRSRSGKSAEGILQAILTEYHSHTQGRDSDDRTLLVARMRD